MKNDKSYSLIKLIFENSDIFVKLSLVFSLILLIILSFTYCSFFMDSSTIGSSINVSTNQVTTNKNDRDLEFYKSYYEGNTVVKSLFGINSNKR